MNFIEVLNEYDKKALKVLEYKGYKGSINQLKDGKFWGKILNDSNLSCVYEGNTIEELEKDFQEMIDF